ncbi:11761_t:CDS:2 [Funneliformis mosseae]|uniref:11761_t:CDS:1 n=1 Tax=Funneliformis mosseae TaxID=27381 RepID=A0A9N9C3U3_FUNMO|nr:11761_t:CDS:2 [Funneliformis mosseae]
MSPNTRSQIRLFCLIYGDSPGSAFEVKINKSETIHMLREVIKDMIDVPDNFKAKNLKLWKVNVPINSPYLNDPSVDIPNVLGGELLLPTNKIENCFSTITEEHIDVIVELPELPTLTVTRNDNDIITILDTMKEMNKEMNEKIDNLIKDKSVIQISSVNEEYLAKILEYTGLDYKTTTLEEELPGLDLNLNERINAFKWSDEAERLQNGRYKTYITNILKLGSFRRLGIYDTINDNSFLTTSADILPMKLSGTTNLVIVDRHSIAMQLPEKHIRILFELKKIIVKADTFQIMAELISADLKSNYTILAVLTDLIDDWRFYWLNDNDRNIIGFKLPRVNAVALLRKNLAFSELEQERSENKELGQELDQVLGISTSEVEEPLPKRQKIKQIIGTTNVSSDIASMEDFFDTMTEEEVFRYKAKRLLIPFFSQINFNQWSEQGQAEVEKELEYFNVNDYDDG